MSENSRPALLFLPGNESRVAQGGFSATIKSAPVGKKSRINNKRRQLKSRILRNAHAMRPVLSNLLIWNLGTDCQSVRTFIPIPADR